jgi:Family of unknown function (DUF5683)
MFTLPMQVSSILRTVLLICCLFFMRPVQGQDTTAVKESPSRMGFSEKWNLKPHSPLRATVYSAIIPGTGQVYNHKTWKGFIALAGLGTCGAFIVYNNNKYQTYRNALIAEKDGDPLTINDTGYPASSLDQLQETYHQWRDLSYICLGAVYVLQVLDANVDGHLFYYDVGSDLSFKFHPSVVNTSGVHPALGLTIRF